jgi:hypothetical protein
VAFAATRRGAELALARFHMRLPFGAWAALQLVPSMYDFDNRVVVSALPDGAVRHRIQLNHHPTRVLYEVGAWPPLARDTGCFRYQFESAYRSVSMRTDYEACVDMYGSEVRVRRIDAR